MKKSIKYSSVLQDFIHPLLEEKDSDEMFLKKIKIAEVIWNYCIAKEFNLPMFVESDKIISQLNKDNTEMKQVFEICVKRKETWFKEYKNLIIKFEYRTNAAGVKSLYVESVEPAAFLKNKQ